MAELSRRRRAVMRTPAIRSSAAWFARPMVASSVYRPRRSIAGATHDHRRSQKNAASLIT
jgi:hypothetical protein